MTLATRAGLPTLLAVSGWPPLALAEDGGPLFAEAARREFVAVAGKSLAGWDAADEAVTGLAASILAEDGPRMSFVYLGAVDAVGHVLGAGAGLPGGGPGRRPPGGTPGGGDPHGPHPHPLMVCGSRGG